MGAQFVVYVAYAFVGIAVFLICRVFFAEEQSRAAQDSLDDGRSKKGGNGLVNFTRPFFNQYIVPSIRGKERWDDKRREYKRKLISAGLKDQLSPDELIAFKAVLIVIFPLIGGLLRALDLFDFGIPMIFLSGIGGWFYPDLWIYMRTKERHQQILWAFPFIVDLLALATEAGLDFMGAIQRVVEKAKPSPLLEELDQMLKEIKVGSSRSEALRELSNRVGLQEIGSFCAILISADQMGASIGKILRQQSEQVRGDRMLRAEKAGAAAQQKLMFPIMFIVVPAVLIMIVAPFVLSWLYPAG